jgi:hypothetical protein
VGDHVGILGTELFCLFFFLYLSLGAFFIFDIAGIDTLPLGYTYSLGPLLALDQSPPHGLSIFPPCCTLGPAGPPSFGQKIRSVYGPFKFNRFYTAPVLISFTVDIIAKKTQSSDSP